MAVIGCAALAVGIFLLDLLIKNYSEKQLEEGETRLFCQGSLLRRKYHKLIRSHETSTVIFSLARPEGGPLCISLTPWAP